MVTVMSKATILRNSRDRVIILQVQLMIRKHNEAAEVKVIPVVII